MNSKFRIFQWNARSAVANKRSLESTLFHVNIDLALISETWFKPGVYYNYRGYNIVRTDREDGRTGAAVFIREKNIFY